jgi:L-lactate dehydrogenase complex protein LldF
MGIKQDTFLMESRQKASDMDHRRKINFSLSQSHKAFREGQLRFSNVEAARQQAKNVKWKALENLDKYLEEFEKNFTLRGGKVIWAQNAQEAREAVLKICRDKQAKKIVKSKSMVTEEIHLNKFLEDNLIEVIETDLGEYIQQLADEPPYHIVAPAMHKSREDVAQLFHEKLNVEAGLPPEQLTLVAREKLREEYREAEIGITGVNFILADIGGIAVTENEGNARLSTSFPQTHIAITGIEKLLPSVDDLDLFWPLLAAFGSGQNITVYNTIFTGPKQKNEPDGPQEMIVILLDNGRTKVLADPEAREILYCIRCGSCLNVCPVYQNIGGHTYATPYSGPIGAVLTPLLEDLGQYKHLSYASSLCGSCTDACPVRINLHKLLLDNRHKAVVENYSSRSEKFGWYAWRKASLSRTIMNMAGGNMKNFVISKLFGKLWGDDRELPVFAPKSFSQLWKERD